MFLIINFFLLLTKSQGLVDFEWQCNNQPDVEILAKIKPYLLKSQKPNYLYHHESGFHKIDNFLSIQTQDLLHEELGCFSDNKLMNIKMLNDTCLWRGTMNNFVDYGFIAFSTDSDYISLAQNFTYYDENTNNLQNSDFVRLSYM